MRKINLRPQDEITALGRTARMTPPFVCRQLKIHIGRFSRFLEGDSCLSIDEIDQVRNYLTNTIRQQVASEEAAQINATVDGGAGE